MQLPESLSIPIMSGRSKKRGTAAQVRNLPEILYENFVRAAELSGMTISEAVQHISRGFVRKVKDRFGEDLFQALTGIEEEVRDAVCLRGASNAAEVADETGLKEQKCQHVLDRLAKYKHLRREESGGRGPKIVRYYPPK